MTSLESASTLPAKVYCDAEVVRDERDAIFRRHWQYVGYESQLPAVGASLFSEVAGTPLVIVRTREGLRAYEAVCRHRAGPLEACHAGGEHFLRCRYHGWSYGHDGALINATEMQGCKDFEPGEVRLPAIELANLQGLIFARLRPGPVDFDALIAGIHERVAASGYELARLQHHATVSYDIDCNWKRTSITFSRAITFRWCIRVSMPSSTTGHIEPSWPNGIRCNRARSTARLTLTAAARLCITFYTLPRC